MTTPVYNDAYKSADTHTSTQATNRSEPVAPLNYEKDEIIEPTSGSDDGSSDSGVHDERPKLTTTQSAATVASAVSQTPSQVAEQKRNEKPWYKQPNPLRWGAIAPVPREREVSREYDAGFWSMLTFQWMAPLMHVGYNRTLEHNDIWKVNPDRSADVMTNTLQESFRMRAARGDEYPLLWAMHDTFKREFWFGGICQFFGSIFQVMSPFTLRYLIQFANNAYAARNNGQGAPDIANGIGLVIGITVMQVLQSLATNHFI